MAALHGARRVAEGDTVVSRFVWQGTHRGVFMGIPPSGRRLRVCGMDLFRLRGGRIGEVVVQMDVLDMMRQLGALPAVAPAGA